MKSQQINVYARFVTDEAASPETERTPGTKVRRVTRRAGGGGARSPKQGLKKQSALPK